MKITTAQYAQYLLNVSETRTESELGVALDMFFRSLQRDGMLSKSKDICSKFSDMWNAMHGVVSVRIVSAKKLSDDVLQMLNTYISARYGAKEVDALFCVDESVVGGVRIELRDEIVDGTLQQRFCDIERFLKQA